MMLLICLLSYPNVRTEPQSEISRNRGEKKYDILNETLQGSVPCQSDQPCHWETIC